MILKAFSVFDVKADAYMAPFFEPTIGMAIRKFADAANDTRSSLSHHPEDYKLVEMGAFNDGTGVLVAVEPVSHGFATDYVKRDTRQGVLPLKEE